MVKIYEFLIKSNLLSTLKANETKSIYNELKKLPESYKIVGENKLKNITGVDFIVIGSTGIFAIKINILDGPIAYNGKELTRWKLPFEKNILKSTATSVYSLQNLLKPKLKENCIVEPVLVFSNFKTKMAFGLNPVENIFIIQKKLLLKLIQERPTIYDEFKINKIAQILEL